MEQNIFFTFQEPEEDSASVSYSMSLDSDYFEIMNDGVSRTTFSYTDTVYLKVFPPSSLYDYSLFSSSGSLLVATKNILYDYEEEITFIQAATSQLGSNPEAIVSYEWIGNSGGTPTFTGQTVTISSAFTGILKVVYKIKGDRLKLSSVAEDVESVLCVAKYDDGVASITVDLEDGELTDVSIIVKDVITEEPIPDASIVVTKSGDTIFTGNANESGEILIPDLIRGETYDIVTTAVDYFSSAEDYLNNDYFTVPTED
jgi:hypothetical protein